MSYAATRFDGRSAASETVSLRIDGDALTIVSRLAVERFALRDVEVSEAFENAPRMLRLPDGATLEVPDEERTLSAELARAGVRESWVVRLQRAWAAVAVAVFVLIGGAFWLYVSGIPVVARLVAEALPPSYERRLGDSVLAMLDEHRLHASRIPLERQAAIEARFREAVAAVAPDADVRLQFRAGAVNAFALPGGTIVLLDGLVDAARSDDEILGVLAHELGHVKGRHSTRQLLQALGVGAIAGLLWGDFSAVATNAPVVLGVMRYGRGFEDEADRFALEFMRRNGLPVQALIDFLERVQQRDGQRGAEAPEFLSTHPGTQARIDRWRRELPADGTPAPR